MNAEIFLDEYRLGWRVWRVHETEEGTFLACITQPDVWHPHIWRPGERFEGVCRAAHEVPHDNHPCGLHILADAKSAEEHMAEYWAQRKSWNIRDPLVIGEVAYWGSTVVHDRGARARFAYPQSFAKGLGPRIEETLQFLRVKYLEDDKGEL